MIEALSHLFAAVCGQNPGHTWAPGGLLLPCCQRCTGLYVGAGLAALLHLWLRPKLTARFLRIHGAFLLFMAPFGFHWVAHGAAMRTITGVLFGFAVVTFLWLPVLGAFRGKARSRGERLKPGRGTSNIQHPTSNIHWRSSGGSLDVGSSMLDVGRSQRVWPALRSTDWTYFVVLAAALALLPLTARSGGTSAAFVLSVLSIWGAFCFAALIAADVSLGLRAAFRWLLRLVSLRVIA